MKSKVLLMAMLLSSAQLYAEGNRRGGGGRPQGGNGGGGDQPRRPPIEAIYACQNSQEKDQCTFTVDGETHQGTCHHKRGDNSTPLACRPNRD